MWITYVWLSNTIVCNNHVIDSFAKASSALDKADKTNGSGRLLHFTVILVFIWTVIYIFIYCPIPCWYFINFFFWPATKFNKNSLSNCFQESEQPLNKCLLHQMKHFIFYNWYSNFVLTERVKHRKKVLSGSSNEFQALVSVLYWLKCHGSRP